MIGIGPCWFTRQLLSASSQISRWYSLVANNVGSRLAVCTRRDNFPSAITGMTSSLADDTGNIWFLLATAPA